MNDAFRAASISELVAEYERAASAHGVATRTGDRTMSNRAHHRLSSVYRILRERGLDAQKALLPLLDNVDPAVRLWAGAHALEFAPDQGRETLAILESGTASPEQMAAKY